MNNGKIVAYREKFSNKFYTKFSEINRAII